MLDYNVALREVILIGRSAFRCSLRFKRAKLVCPLSLHSSWKSLTSLPAKARHLPRLYAVLFRHIFKPHTCVQAMCTMKAYAWRLSACMVGARAHICKLVGKVSPYHPCFPSLLFPSLFLFETLSLLFPSLPFLCLPCVFLFSELSFSVNHVVKDRISQQLLLQLLQ